VDQFVFERPDWFQISIDWLVVLDLCHFVFLSLGRGRGKRGLLVARVTGGQIIFSIYSTFFLTGSVWFELTGFCLTKPKPNRTGIFSKYSNRFFFGSVFSVNFFSLFSV